MINTHIVDGEITKFYWTRTLKKLNEYQAQNKLENLENSTRITYIQVSIQLDLEKMGQLFITELQKKILKL